MTSNTRRSALPEAAAGGGVALMIEDVGHTDGLLGNAGLPGGGEVMITNPHQDLGERVIMDTLSERSETSGICTSDLGTGCLASWS